MSPEQTTGRSAREVLASIAYGVLRVESGGDEQRSRRFGDLGRMPHARWVDGGVAGLKFDRGSLAVAFLHERHSTGDDVDQLCAMGMNLPGGPVLGERVHGYQPTLFAVRLVRLTVGLVPCHIAGECGEFDGTGIETQVDGILRQVEFHAPSIGERSDASAGALALRACGADAMLGHSMDWNDVRYFLALARLGSVRAAGASLGVSHSTVARRVEALEVQLAARLFDRNRDGYVLTEAGEKMLPGAEDVERGVSALERQLAGHDERFAGPVRLTCCDEYVSEMMLRELAVFCGAYPDVELCITTDSRPFDLSKREADIAVRTLPTGAQPREHLIGRKLVPVVCANYVAVAHAVRLDPAREGASPRWVGFEGRKYVEAMIAASSYPHIAPWGSFSSLGLMLQATREGLGIAMLPCYVADRDPALKRLAKPDIRHVADLWLLSHPDLRENARLHAARACVAQALTRRMALFRGETSAADATSIESR